MESDRVLLVEDVVTKGGRINEALEILKKTSCSVLGITSLVDRSNNKIDFGFPFQPLLKLNFPTYKPDELPKDLLDLKPIKPGS